MYHLKNVYGVINFDYDQIHVVVLQSGQYKKHCLFSKSIFIDSDYLSDNNLDINAIFNPLKELLMQANLFINLPIKRYLITVPHLAIELVHHNINDLVCEDESEVLKSLQHLTAYNDLLALKRQIINYQLNNNTIQYLPKNTPCGVSYIDLCANKNLINRFNELFNLLKIEQISFDNNITAFMSSNKNASLIDLDLNKTTINVIDDQHRLVEQIDVNYGINNFVELIQNDLKINDTNIINKLINNLDVLLNLNDDQPIINYFENQFLAIKQLKISDLKKLIYQWVQTYFDVINKAIQKFDLKKIVFNTNHPVNYLFNYIINESLIKINDVVITCLNENILGVDTYNLFACLYAINNASGLETCSIDPYAPEEITSRQFHRNLIVKFGIISTQISAKLGQVEEI